MDKETLQIIDEAANSAVAKMREFHLDDLKMLGERMNIGFESIDRRFDRVESRLDTVETGLSNVEDRLDGMNLRFDGVENALATLLRDFKEEREKVDDLKRQISDLTYRVQTLEKKLATAH
jgi:chromosome segregation ATPase